MQKRSERSDVRFSRPAALVLFPQMIYVTRDYNAGLIHFVILERNLFIEVQVLSIHLMVYKSQLRRRNMMNAMVIYSIDSDVYECRMIIGGRPLFK